MNETPAYYAVIPASVRYHKELCANAKLLYGEITCLCNLTGECWATNAYFAELYGVKPDTISEWIGQLKANGFLAVMIERDPATQQVTRRTVKPFEQAVPYREKTGEGIGEKPEENTTSSKSLYGDFLKSFNEITGRRMRILDKKAQGQLNARLREGFTIAEILTAVRNCLNDEYHRENPQYLTPEFITRSDKLQKFLFVPEAADVRRTEKQDGQRL